MRIGWVKKVKDEGVREQLIEELVSEHSELSDLDRMSVLVAQLELLDTQRHVLPHEASSGITEASAAKIINAADKLAALVDTSNLAIVLSNRQSASVVSEDEARARRDAAKSRNMLASALTSKCRALAFQVSADSSSDALKEYESAVAQLAKWSDTSSNPVPDITHLFAAVIPLHMCKSEYAQALMALSMWTKLAPMTRANAAGWKTVAVLQIQLLAKLGWSAWADNFKNRLFEECPGVRVPS
ncbi:hypothetical protein FBU59_006299 [Linderina macrospora]|uniref:Uncharacterized protein n=1 Tax=Linderina macrospora TaxID=4868 RepID=A0ACC1J0C6_9FUNG|nr:hypothetical protein FBU59_006299 [Linderina macrospora]